MVDYSLPLQVRPLDLPGAYGAAAQYSLNRAGADLRQEQVRDSQERRGALEAYAALPAGDPRARDTLRAHPELYSQTLANESATENAKLTANARAAMRVKGVADPAQRMQHWQEELDQAAREGRIPTLMHQRLRQTQPTDQLLDAIAGQAQKPLTDVDRATIAEKQARATIGIPAEAAAHMAAAQNSIYKPVPADSAAIYSGRSGETKAITGADPFESVARKEAAKEAPKAHAASQTALTDAVSNLSMVKDLKQVAPLASTGAGAEAGLAFKKLVQLFGFNPRDLGLRDNVGPTEYLQAAINKFSIAEAKKLYPISNADLGFIQKAVGSISTDPTALPLILGAMERIYEREAAFRQLESEAIKKGPFVDRNAIIARVNQRYPSFIEGYLDEASQSGPQGAPSAVPRQQTGQLPVPPAQALDEARRAIQRGAPAQAVIERLRRSGIDPSPLMYGPARPGTYPDPGQP